MVRLTLIARVADGLPLAEGLDSDNQQELDVCKSQAKASQNPQLETRSRCSNALSISGHRASSPGAADHAT